MQNCGAWLHDDVYDCNKPIFSNLGMPQWTHIYDNWTSAFFEGECSMHNFLQAALNGSILIVTVLWNEQKNNV